MPAQTQAGPSFHDPEVLQGKYFVRSYKFSPDRQQMIFTISPTDQEARDQEIAVTVLNDPSVDKNGILKKMCENIEDVVSLGMIRERGADSAQIYQAEPLRKMGRDANTVMGVDADGRKRLAFTWTEALDNHVDRWHGYQTKAEATNVLAELAQADLNGSKDSLKTVSARAKAEAISSYQELVPGCTEEYAKEWVEANWSERASIGEVLVGSGAFFHTDHPLEHQLNWGKLDDKGRAQAIVDYSYQKSLQRQLVDIMTTPREVTRDGKPIPPLQTRESALVNAGMLYAKNPTLTPELAVIKDREFAERESGKAVRSAMALLGNKPSDVDYDDVRKGETEPDESGVLQPATIQADILQRTEEDPEFASAAQLSGDASTCAKLNVFSSAANKLCSNESQRIIYGEDHGIIAEQDDHGAVEEGFSRRHVLESEEKKKKAEEKRRERMARGATHITDGIDAFVGDGRSDGYF